MSKDKQIFLQTILSIICSLQSLNEVLAVSSKDESKEVVVKQVRRSRSHLRARGTLLPFSNVLLLLLLLPPGPGRQCTAPEGEGG